MIHKSDQGFSTIDTISIALSLVLLLAIIIPITSHRMDVQHAYLAENQARDLSVKIPNIELMAAGAKTGEGGRELASLSQTIDLKSGRVSTDPWGQPYYYTYIKNAAGQPAYIAVWSSGPNSVSDTPEAHFDITHFDQLSASFKGDDVGIVRAIR